MPTGMASKLRIALRPNRRQQRSEPLSAWASTTTVAGAAIPSPPTSFSMPPGDQPVSFPPGHKVSAEELRDLSELIRQRYTLDIEIWGKRHCAARDRHLVEKTMIRADAALDKINGLVRAWDREDVWASPSDHLLLQHIRYKLETLPGKRIWRDDPPWSGV